MPRSAPSSPDTLSSLFNSIAALLADALVAGAKSAIASSAATTAAAPVKRGPGRPPKSASAPAAVVAPAKRGPGRPPKVGGKACLVAGCGRKTVAKGLCQGHYRKANRLNVIGNLDKSALAKLAEDGRATRWASKKKK